MLGRRKLGRSGINVPPLGLGGAAIGGLYEPVGPRRAEETVRRALERGLRYLDTAPHYGLGRSESHIGAVLSGVPREGYVLSTKVGRRLRPLRQGEPADPQGFADPPPLRRYWDWSADGIRACVEESLTRLGVDRLDVVYLHDPDDHEDEVYATGYPALAALREEGLVAAIGAGMNQTAMLTRFVSRLDLDVVLCAGRYTLLDQSALGDLLPECERRGTSVIVGGAFNSGLLADPRPGAPYDYRPAPPERLRRARAIARVCASHNVPMRAAALRFPLGHPSVAGVLVGCRGPEEVDDNADLFARDVPASLWPDLRVTGLLDPAAPIPTKESP